MKRETAGLIPRRSREPLLLVSGVRSTSLQHHLTSALNETPFSPSALQFYHHLCEHSALSKKDGAVTYFISQFPLRMDRYPKRYHRYILVTSEHTSRCLFSGDKLQGLKGVPFRVKVVL